MTGATWLGGHHVYREEVEVAHTADQSFTSEFVPVLRHEELKEGQLHRVEMSLGPESFFYASGQNACVGGNLYPFGWSSIRGEASGWCCRMPVARVPV